MTASRTPSRFQIASAYPRTGDVKVDAVHVGAQRVVPDEPSIEGSKSGYISLIVDFVMLLGQGVIFGDTFANHIRNGVGSQTILECINPILSRKHHIFMRFAFSQMG